MPTFTHKNHGFTLIELITVIIILGVVSVGFSGFVRTGLDIYTDVTEREQLLSESRFAVERLNRELRGAVPNSVRVRTDLTDKIQCIEFVPAQWVTFYTTLPVLPSSATSMKLTQVADNSAGYIFSVGDSAVVYPTESADVYDLDEDKRQTITACEDTGAGNCTDPDDPGESAEMTVSGPFADYSPASRVYFANHAVSYCANNSGSIYRIEDSFNIEQDLYTSGTLMAEHFYNDFDNSDELPFTLSEATYSRNSLVNILLTFEHNDEVVNFNSEVHIPNVP